jgi:hypothetical protein
MSHPMGYYAWPGSWEALGEIEEACGSHFQKLSEDQRNQAASSLLVKGPRPVFITERVWSILLTDTTGFSKALINS